MWSNQIRQRPNLSILQIHRPPWPNEVRESLASRRQKTRLAGLHPVKVKPSLAGSSPPPCTGNSRFLRQNKARASRRSLGKPSTCSSPNTRNRKSQNRRDREGLFAATHPIDGIGLAMLEYAKSAQQSCYRSRKPLAAVITDLIRPSAMHWSGVSAFNDAFPVRKNCHLAPGGRLTNSLQTLSTPASSI